MSKLPDAVLAYWKSKRLVPGFSWLDVWREEHDRAFTVAKVMATDLLGDIQTSLTEALEQGLPYEQWRRDLKPTLVRKGWWAPHDVTDPQTGERRRVDPPARLALVYDTNLRQARAVGQSDRIERTKQTHPYVLWSLGPSAHHRDEHVKWHGLLLRVGDPWLDSHWPPCGFRCKCHLRSVSEAEANQLKRDGIPDPFARPERVGGVRTGHKVGGAKLPVRTQPPAQQMRTFVNRRTGVIVRHDAGVHPGFGYRPGSGRPLARQP